MVYFSPPSIASLPYGHHSRRTPKTVRVSTQFLCVLAYSRAKPRVNATSISGSRYRRVGQPLASESTLHPLDVSTAELRDTAGTGYMGQVLP